MKRTLMFLAAFAFLPVAGAMAAEPAAAEPAADCSAQQTAYDELAKAPKVKADLTSCKEMKGKEKADCEKPLKEQAKADATAAKEKKDAAKKALDCCKHPKKKGCS
jgi:hypothetical protein